MTADEVLERTGRRFRNDTLGKLFEMYMDGVQRDGCQTMSS